LKITNRTVICLALSWRRDVPIIALTAYAMKGDKEKALEAGCDAYIAKPIIPEELIEAVNSYLKGKVQ